MASKGLLDDIDSDSENDSDYNPAEDDEQVEQSLQRAQSSSSSSGPSLQEMTASRKRKVDDAFRALIEEDKKLYQTNKASLSVSSALPGLTSINSVSVNKKKSLSKTEKKFKVLSKLFGSIQAKEMMAAAGIDASGVGDDRAQFEDIDTSPDKGVKEAIKKAIQNVQKKQKVTETRKFAGQEIKVETTVIANAFPSRATSNPTHKAISSTASLDAVLETIKGPKTVSTVSKSSMDWDNFKEKEGIADELTKATHDGYLTKKEFLDRCDYRNFETERDARLKAMTANLQSGV